MPKVRNNVVFESTTNLNRMISLSHTLSHMPSTRFNQRSKQITKTIMILGISTSQKLLFDNVMVYNFYLIFQYWRSDNANDLRQQRKNKHSYCKNFVHINNVYVWELYGVKIHLSQPYVYQYLGYPSRLSAIEFKWYENNLCWIHIEKKVS